jgi:hypothetical protein
MRTEDIAKALAEILPKHIELSIEHNPHVGSYATLREFDSLAQFDWVSDEERDRAFEANDCWVATWNPNTPVGSCTSAASTLAALLKDLSFTSASESVLTPCAECECTGACIERGLCVREL